MKKSELRNIIKEELGILSEDNSLINHAKKFTTDVLKLGSKDNIFDIYIKKNKMNAADLSEFVAAVAKELKDNWS